jgi:hypothetical protein
MQTYPEKKQKNPTCQFAMACHAVGIKKLSPVSKYIWQGISKPYPKHLMGPGVRCIPKLLKLSIFP